MKNFLIILLSLLFATTASSQSDPCQYTNGIYFYYANVNVDTVYDTFSKQDFINHLIDSSNISTADSIYLDNVITLVDKSFPTATTNFLTHSVTVYSTTDTLENFLSSFTNSLNLVEYICYNHQLTSIKDNINDFDFSVYPNPLSDNSTLKISNIDAKAQLRIIDANGRIVKTINTNSEIDMDLSKLNLTQGIYYFQLRTTNNYQTIKVVK